MLKILDVLIGATTVVLIFSMAVTVLTQTVTSAFNRRGAHLKSGLGGLLQQLGIPSQEVAEKIADAVLRHPTLSEGKGWWGFGNVKLGTVIHREEFTKILMDAVSGNSAALWTSLGDDGKNALKAMLTSNGITDPDATLKNVRTMAMQLEASNPELATDVRQSLALLREAESDYVARVNSWFDQTIDRVSQRFTRYAHYVTLGLAAVVVIAVQLDMIAVVDRLSIDDTLRDQIVQSVIKDTAANGSGGAVVPGQKTEGQQGAAPDASGTKTPGAQSSSSGAPAASNQQEQPGGSSNRPGQPTEQLGKQATEQQLTDAATQKYYQKLGDAGLITMPWGTGWASWMASFSARKIPGMILAILMISLGAPFWYSILKNLLGLRSLIAQKDDAQRLTRQTTQDTSGSPAAGAASTGNPLPPSLKGERGDLEAAG